jgi:ribosome-associated translation inhibitor RaiA
MEVTMRIDIRACSLKLTPTLRDYVRRRIRFALGRFMLRLKNVRVVLKDLNGPKGGVDKHCKVFVNIMPSFSVIIEERDADLETAINRALDRAGRTVARRLDQVLDRRKAR